MESNLLAVAWAQLWQVTLLIVVTAILARVLARNRPYLAYALWLVVLVKCVTPPLLTSASGVFCWLQPAETVEVAVMTSIQPSNLESLTAPSHAEQGDLVIPLYPLDAVPMEPAGAPVTIEPQLPRFSLMHLAFWGLAAWAIGAALSVTLSAWRWQACLRAARRARAGRNADLEQRVQVLAQRIGLRRPVRVIVTKGRLGPAVTGILRPTLLLPEGIVHDRTPDELEPILAHELIHIRRGDLWAGVLQTAVLALWWFHPLVRWAVRESMRDAERCCDEAVLAELGCKPKEYARGLLDVLQYKTDWLPAPAFPGAGRIDATAKRLERIMRLGQGCRRRSPWWCWLVMLAAAAVVLPGGAFVVSGENEESDVDNSATLEVAETAEKLSETSSASTAATPKTETAESEKVARLIVAYRVDDVLSEIAHVTDSMDLAKVELMEKCGFDADRQGPQAPDSRIVWKDDTMIALATEAEHETICAELEAIREHGLCPLEIEVLCVQGPPAEIRAILESEGPLAKPLLKEQHEREATVGHIICESLVLHTNLDNVMRHSRANPAVRVLASPRLRVNTGRTASIRIGEEVPYGVSMSKESAAVRHAPVGVEMQFQPRLRAGNRVLLHSDVTVSEAVGEADNDTRAKPEGSSLATTVQIVSRKASSTTLGPLGETIAIKAQGPANEEGNSEQILFLVRVDKSKADYIPSTRSRVAGRCWDLLGFKFEPIDDVEWERDFNTRYRGGLRIMEVRPGSPAAEEKMRVGDVLVSCGKLLSVFGCGGVVPFWE